MDAYCELDVCPGDPLERTIPKPADDPDHHLVYRAQADDKEALSQLLTKYGATILRTALRITGDSHDAEDVCQEASIKICKSIRTFQGSGKVQVQHLDCSDRHQ